MLRNYFRLIWRHFLKDRQFTLLNLVGLSTGLACALLIYLWVSDELQVDKFHEKDSRLYQVMENRQQSGGILTSPTTSALLAESLAEDMPEVEYAAAVAQAPWSENITLSVNENNTRATGKYVGKDYFNIFSYPLIEGDKKQVLADKNSIVISEGLAQKLFGTTSNLAGKPITWQHDQQYLISGVFKNLPSGSSDQFDFVMSFELYKDRRGKGIHWGNTAPFTFVVLKAGTDIPQFNKKIVNYLKTKTNGDIKYRTLFARQYSSGYLHGKYENGVQAGGRITYVQLFSIIAIFILVIACINFMNLSTAKAAGRMKEVGIQKTIGARRGVLILQYLTEAILMTLLALIIALVLAALLLPVFNQLTGKQLALQMSPGLIATLVAITVSTGLLAGSYPALYLSGFNAVTVLKGKLRTSAAELLARKGLVIFQFTLSIVLIIAVLVVYRQIEFVQSKHLGYDKDNIIYFDREGKTGQTANLETFLAGMRNMPGIVNASSINHDLTGHNSGTYGVLWEGSTVADRIEFENASVNYGLIETLGMKMVEGRDFSDRSGADTSRIIFNETAIRFMKLKDPVGKKVKLWGEDMEITGVVKDFHFESLHENVKPLFFLVRPENTRKIMAKIEAGKEKETIARLQQWYQQFNPGFSLDYKFLDADYQAQYIAEDRVSVLSRYFAGLAILISCLGLFGLAAFTAQRRQKEIGIRKTLGASVTHVVIMLSKDFCKQVLIAVVIAFPLAWWAVNQWLHGFAYRVPVGVTIFLIAGMATMMLTLLTISFQAIRAALANPVTSLKTE